MQRDGTLTLFIAGPGEFLADRYVQPKTTYDAQKLAQVQHDAMNAMLWDAVYLSEKAAAWFERYALRATLRNSTPVSGGTENQVPTQIITKGPWTIGILFIPPARAADGQPDEEDIQTVVDAARSLQGRADLVIALSPWGMHMELNLARRFEGLIHILLGGGDGIGLSPQVMQDAPSVLWVRSEVQGRSLVTLALPQFPNPMSPSPWMEGINFTWKDYPLGPEVSEDPELRAMLAESPVDPQ